MKTNFKMLCYICNDMSGPALRLSKWPPYGIHLNATCWEEYPGAWNAQCTDDCVPVTMLNGTEKYPAVSFYACYCCLFQSAARAKGGHTNKTIQEMLFRLLISLLSTNKHEHFCVIVPQPDHRYIREHPVGVSIDELLPRKPAEVHT